MCFLVFTVLLIFSAIVSPFSVYCLAFLLVISSVSIGLLFGCDDWSKSLGCGCKHYLGIGSRRISVGLEFSALNVKE